ncbi:MAG: aldehyde ferredoxin oxidoreductase family protein [Candidatus Thorarchaeota archaeon]
MKGFMGEILVVDLSDNTTNTIPIDEKIAKKFLGGSGYASRILYDLIDGTTDPLGPDNILMFMTGPLTGTLAPCTGRHVVCGKSPLTGFWGESHSGGHFGAFLKFSGYDGILIKGKAKTPVTIHVNDKTTSILDAQHLWGKTTDVTQKILRDELGKVQTACIGPAGEMLVKFAGIINDERSAARCGLGAVMGSKFLKAISVEGSNRPELTNDLEFREVATESFKTLGEVMEILRESGTATYVDVGMMYYDMPVKYFQETEFDVDGLNASAMKEILVGRSACYSCPIACGRKISLSEYDLKEIAGPEYQTIAAFGSNMMIDDLKKVAYMNHLCNQYGMDTISCGSTLAFAIHLCDIGKLEWGLTWGDPESMIDLIHAIAKRRGYGDELAEGSMRLAKKYNASDIAIHVKGLEVANHDPRAFGGMAAIYAVAARGGTHLEGDMYSVDMGVEVRELGLVAGDPQDDEGKGRIAAIAQDFRAFFDSAIMCHFAIVPTEKILNLVSKALSTSFELIDILKIGARAVTMKRLFNLRCGLQPSDDRLPKVFLKPQPGSVTYDYVPDVEKQIKEYYEYRKWDLETGKPTQPVFDKLDLDC